MSHSSESEKEFEKVLEDVLQNILKEYPHSDKKKLYDAAKKIFVYLSIFLEDYRNELKIIQNFSPKNSDTERLYCLALLPDTGIVFGENPKNSVLFRERFAKKTINDIEWSDEFDKEGKNKTGGKLQIVSDYLVENPNKEIVINAYFGTDPLYRLKEINPERNNNFKSLVQMVETFETFRYETLSLKDRNEEEEEEEEAVLKAQLDEKHRILKREHHLINQKKILDRHAHNRHANILSLEEIRKGGKIKSKASPKRKSKASPKRKSKASPKRKSKASPKRKPKASPKRKPKASPKRKPKASPKRKRKSKK
jgi:hypothetical protein